MTPETPTSPVPPEGFPLPKDNWTQNLANPFYQIPEPPTPARSAGEQQFLSGTATSPVVGCRIREGKSASELDTGNAATNATIAARHLESISEPAQSETTTPRTDAVADPTVDCVTADFARQLERELDEALSWNKEACDTLFRLGQDIATITEIIEQREQAIANLAACAAERDEHQKEKAFLHEKLKRLQHELGRNRKEIDSLLFIL